MPAWPDCEASSQGRIRQFGELRKIYRWDRPPYDQVYLRGIGVRYVHRLVAEAFYGPRPSGFDTRHLDGDTRNNAASNLAYGTRSRNQLDSVQHGTQYEASRTHCSNGHEFTPENTYQRSDAGRRCVQCKLAEGHARYVRQQHGGVEPEFRKNEPWPCCSRGHALSADNVYTNPTTGKRRCRTCRQREDRERRARRSGRGATD
ncbi:HNH endonuclease signature motif containing protein [Nocardia otitidiscaviarum]|uniref:HNH endonuclease signature motif containing protein n=1 Tax=Nocardia otitidiscaviarum TaxID=1823 RepID=UPI0034E613B5